MATIKWSEEAHHWLRDIFDYIARDNPAAARKVVVGKDDPARILRRFPKMGRRRRRKPVEEWICCSTAIIE